MVSCCQGNNRGGSDPPLQHGGFYGNLATVHLRALTVTLSDIRELKQRRRRRQRERQKSNRFRLAKQQLCTCITLFCTFLCRPCTTSTWNCLISRFVKDVDTRQWLSFSYRELWHNPLEFNSGKICQHLMNGRRWSKCSKDHSSLYFLT